MIELSISIEADGSGEYSFDQAGYHESKPFLIDRDGNRFTVNTDESILSSCEGIWSLEGGILKLDITSTLAGGRIFTYTAECEKKEELSTEAVSQPVIQAPKIQTPVITPPKIQTPVIAPTKIQTPVINPPVITPPAIKTPTVSKPIRKSDAGNSEDTIENIEATDSSEEDTVTSEGVASTEDTASMRDVTSMESDASAEGVDLTQDDIDLNNEEQDAASGIATVDVDSLVVALGEDAYRTTYDVLLSGDVIQTGSKGDAAQGLQKMLISFGKDIKADGSVGRKTIAALNEVQAAFGLPETESVDARIFAQLLPRLLISTNPEQAEELLSGTMEGSAYCVSEQPLMRGRTAARRVASGHAARS